MSLHLAITDARFTAASIFGRAMQGRLVPVAEYLGDITTVWYEHLDPVWRSAPIAIGGLTTAGTLFCLERLAWGHGMRLIYRGTHCYHPGGGTQHLLESTIGDDPVILDAIAEEGAWSAQIADLVLNLASAMPARPLQRRSLCSMTYSKDGLGGGTEGPILTSWLIAPRGRLE